MTIRKTAGPLVRYPELSNKIMQAAFEVHGHIGPGFTENIYEEALVYEFEAQQIPYERQKSIQVSYKGSVIGRYQIDLVVDGKIILELKALTDLTDLHKQQLLSYLKATDLHLGILINFGAKKVVSVRIVN